MERDFYFIELFEIYKGLLTETQRKIFYSHYFLDLSYSEIAEEDKTSRQSVSDAVKKVKIKLEEYEKQLKLRELQKNILEIADGVKDPELSRKLRETVIK